MFCVFCHEEPDEVPFFEGELTTVEALDTIFGNQMEKIRDPIRRALFKARFWGNSCIYVGPWGLDFLNERVEETGEYWMDRSIFGTLWYTKKKTLFRKMTHAPLKNYEDLKSLNVLSPNYEKLNESIKAISVFLKRGYFVITSHKGPFESTWYYLRGLSEYLRDLVRDPTFAKRLIPITLRPQIELSKALIEAGAQAVVIGDDMGTSNGLFFSPQIYRQIFQPWHKRIVDIYHKMGAFVILHSHGNINKILEDLVEAGFDAINPLDPDDGIDLAKIKQNCGEKVVVYGGISRSIGRMTQEEIARHMENVITTGAPGGGFILSLGGGIPTDMIMENLTYLRQILKNLRKYPCNLLKVQK